MEILGIGPGEFVFILVVLLVVVGPERLPDLARQAGRLLVRGRNWLQSSPDAAMVLRARQEIEQELASLRTSLLEVQNVRDEVMGAARQIGESVESLASAARTELTDITSGASLRPTPKASTPLVPAADGSSAPAGKPPALDSADGAPAALPEAAEAADSVAGDSFKLPEAWTTYPEKPAVPASPEPAPPNEHTSLAAIDVRLQAIMSDLFALQQQLRERGVLADDWQPPSWQVHLPATPTQANAAPQVAAEEAPSS